MSTVLHPINRLLQKGVEFVGDKACQSAFNRIKREIVSDGILCHFDPNRELILATDASPYANGAVMREWRETNCVRFKSAVESRMELQSGRSGKFGNFLGRKEVF